MRPSLDRPRAAALLNAHALSQASAQPGFGERATLPTTENDARIDPRPPPVPSLQPSLSSPRPHTHTHVVMASFTATANFFYAVAFATVLYNVFLMYAGGALLHAAATGGLK